MSTRGMAPTFESLCALSHSQVFNSGTLWLIITHPYVRLAIEYVSSGMLRLAGVKVHVDSVSTRQAPKGHLLLLIYFSSLSMAFTYLHTIFQHTSGGFITLPTGLCVGIVRPL